MASHPGSRERGRDQLQDFVRARPAKRKFGLEYLGVRVSLHTLADGGNRVVHPYPTTHGESRCRAQCVGEGGVSAGNARNGEGMVFANNIVRALLSVCSQVALDQVVAGQTLVSRYYGAFENRQGETWKPTHANLVGRQTRRRADRTVASELDLREPQIPVVLSLVDDHRQHLGHSVVHRLNAPVALRMIRACGKLAHSQQLVYSLRKRGTELQAVVRE